MDNKPSFTNPLHVLLSTVDRLLADQGVNPSLVADGDKILIAAQYVETGSEREKMFLTRLPKDPTRDALPDSAPDPV